MITLTISLVKDKNSPSYLALEKLKKRISECVLNQYGDHKIIINYKNTSSVSLTGIKGAHEKEHIMEKLQEIWEDDSWLID